jgi:hypothetical protein
MEARLNAQQASPAAYEAMISLEMFVREGSNLESSLIEDACLADQSMCLLY